MRRILVSALFLVGLNLLAGCSTTTLNAVWKDPEYGKGPVASTLVVGVTKNDTLRRLSEDNLATALQRRGVNAVASYRVFPEADQLEKARVEEKVRELGLDSILITRIIDQEEVKVRHPERVYVDSGVSPYRYPSWHYPYYRSWDAYYRHSYQVTRTPATTTEATVYQLETNLYQAENGEVIWSALSETFARKGLEREIEGLVDTIIDSLEEKRLI